MSPTRILIVDDEQGFLEVCHDTLVGLADTELVMESDDHLAAERLAGESWDLLITDLRMQRLGGVELLRLGRQRHPDLPVLMITAFPCVETAVESMKLGAADYITKPFLPEELLKKVKHLLELRKLEFASRSLHDPSDRPFGDMIGKSEAMQKVFETIERIAPTDMDVLILGETGTGKELVARSIHQRSGRKSKPFVPVDCGAIPTDLLESELFGHERGSFTGAHSRSPGLLELADQGSFFLDEIGELSPALHVKLLRTLQERRIRRVGGKEEVEVNVRVIAATSRDLKTEMEAGRFRADLYYRINVASIELPPLRERIEDIPLLTGFFVDHYSREIRRDPPRITGEALARMNSYAWPGNIRQLQNVIRRMLAMCTKSTISAADLPAEITEGAQSPVAFTSGSFFELRERRLHAFERRYLADLLRESDGDVCQAARRAEVPRSTLYRLLRKNDLDPATFCS